MEYDKHTDLKMENLEHGWLFYAVKGLWPVAMVASAITLLLFAISHMVVEAIVQYAILVLMVDMWPWIKGGYR